MKYVIAETNLEIEGDTYAELLIDYQNATDDNSSADEIINNNPAVVAIVVELIKGLNLSDLESKCRVAIGVLINNGELS